MYHGSQIGRADVNESFCIQHTVYKKPSEAKFEVLNFAFNGI
jgi:hypothetical protein